MDSNAIPTAMEKSPIFKAASAAEKPSIAFLPPTNISASLAPIAAASMRASAVTTNSMAGSAPDKMPAANSVNLPLTTAILSEMASNEAFDLSMIPGRDPSSPCAVASSPVKLRKSGISSPPDLPSNCIAMADRSVGLWTADMRSARSFICSVGVMPLISSKLNPRAEKARV